MLPSPHPLMHTNLLPCTCLPPVSPRSYITVALYVPPIPRLPSHISLVCSVTCFSARMNPLPVSQTADFLSQLGIGSDSWMPGTKMPSLVVRFPDVGRMFLNVGGAYQCEAAHKTPCSEAVTAHDDHVDQETQILPHRFHLDCCQTWLKDHKSCQEPEFPENL